MKQDSSASAALLAEMLRQLNSDPAGCSYELLDASARESWALTFLSATDQTVLDNYFTLHARQLFDLIALGKQQELLCKLADHLLSYFGSHISKELSLPVIYTRYKREQLRCMFSALTGNCRSRLSDEKLRGPILDYLHHILGPGVLPRLSVADMIYADTFLQEINILFENDLENLLSARLISLGFNHLGFLTFLQENTNSEIATLNPGKQLAALRQKAAYFCNAERKDSLCYDPHWPPLSRMMQEWLTAEIAARGHQAVAPFELVRIPLDLSVAHLGCLLHLFVAEELPKNVPLKLLFKFMAANFSTRRQPEISAGSLSKEFYSITQVTAATVRDLLLRMVSRINRDFFPVAAAIGIIHYFQ